jgi:hypothetical protein
MIKQSTINEAKAWGLGLQATRGKKATAYAFKESKGGGLARGKFVEIQDEATELVPEKWDGYVRLLDGKIIILTED